jgi:CHASE2 domain-containing sensor protein
MRGMKSFYHIRYLIVTLMMFLLIGILSLIPFNCLFLDPVAKAISDFDVYDIVYSKIREEPAADTSIVLVNIGNLSRLEIAHQINVINSYNPYLIAIDAIFQEEKESFCDSVLADAFSKCNNLVLVSKLDKFDETNDTYDTLITSLSLFSKYSTNGFANLPNDDKVSFKTIRDFRPLSKVNGSIIPALASKVVEIYDTDAYRYLMNRQKGIEKINYTGNFNRFYYLDADQVLSGEENLEFLRNKIVLIGFMGTDLNNKTLEDIYFTPLNERYAGKSFPDMYGVVIHANILSMILRKNYVDNMPTWMSIVFAFILSYVSAFIIHNLKSNYKDWFGALTKIYILLITLINLFAGVMIYHHFNYKINLTLALAVIVLTATALELYQNFVSKIFPSLEN